MTVWKVDSEDEAVNDHKVVLVVGEAATTWIGWLSQVAKDAVTPPLWRATPAEVYTAYCSWNESLQ